MCTICQTVLEAGPGRPSVLQGALNDAVSAASPERLSAAMDAAVRRAMARWAMPTDRLCTVSPEIGGGGVPGVPEVVPYAQDAANAAAEGRVQFTFLSARMAEGCKEDWAASLGSYGPSSRAHGMRREGLAQLRDLMGCA